jgi:radical SAM protein with 4Fe4S-binding SPASM domain
MKTKNIETISIAELKQLSTDKEFTKLWNIKKDDTKVCKDCEYRYMCVDDRIPIKISETEYKYSTECGYNPYIAKWQDEEGWISVEQLQKENFDRENGQ